MNRMRAVRRAAGLMLLLLIPPGAALAQGTGVLEGTVVDTTTKQPIADVTVTATSPRLQGEQFLVTDDTGLYRLPQLPPGTYTLRFDKEGYRPYVREGVALRLDQQLRLNVELLPDVAGSTTITVYGKAPTVDVGSSSVGVSLTSDFIRHVPVALPAGKGAAARSFESLAEAAPGAHSDTYGTSISGTTSPENQYMVDGVSVNDPGFGINGSPLSVEFVQEVNVNTGGYMPEYGRATGGVLSVVTKSGSNELHGSVFGNLTPGALASAPLEIRSAASTVSSQSSLWNLGDFGFEVGGPILKDKLWFFVGAAPSFTRYQVQRNLNAVVLDETGAPAIDEFGFTKTTRINGTERSFFADQRQLQFLGKLTYNVNKDNSLAFTVSGSPTSSGSPGGFAISERTGRPETDGTNVNGTYESFATRRASNALETSVKWSSAFLDKHVLLDVTGGWHRQNLSRHASDGTALASGQGLSRIANVTWARTDPGLHSLLEFENIPDPSVCGGPDEDPSLRCPALNYTTGGPGFLNEMSLDRYQTKAVGTFIFNVLGRHVMKAGVDAELTRLDQSKGLSGKVAYLEGDDGSYFQDFRQYGYLTGPDQAVIQDVQSASSRSTTLGGFIQDSWQLFELVTLNLGVRYDTQSLVGGNQLALVLGNQWSPRLGFIVDPTRAGRSKIYGNYARFYENVPLDMVDRGFPGERQVVSLKDAALCNPLDPEQQQTSCLSEAARIPFRPALDASTTWSGVGGGATIVDPKIQPQSNDELVFGGEYEVFNNARVGASYTHRYQNMVVEDMSRDDGATYFLGNPGYGFASDFPKAVRDYDALTVYFNKAFADGWLAQVSYTWSSLRGNWEGLFRADSGQLDPNINSDFDLISLLPNRAGPLPADHTHQIKVFGAKEFRLGSNASIGLGVGYRGNSGAPWSYLGAHEFYGAGEAFILPRGSAGRLPWVHRLDGQLAFNYRLDGDRTISVTADIFNLLNLQAVTRRDENYTYSGVVPIENGTRADLGNLQTSTGAPFDPINKNPNFGNPISYQTPRTVRIGARISF